MALAQRQSIVLLGKGEVLRRHGVAQLSTAAAKRGSAPATTRIGKARRRAEVQRAASQRQRSAGPSDAWAWR